MRIIKSIGVGLFLLSCFIGGLLLIGWAGNWLDNYLPVYKLTSFPGTIYEVKGKAVREWNDTSGRRCTAMEGHGMDCTERAQ